MPDPHNNGSDNGGISAQINSQADQQSAARPTHIRSFVMRRSHMTDGQQAAIDTLKPRYAIAYRERPVNADDYFAQRAPLLVEIGCGMGETSVQIAAANPANNYLGLEVYPAGVGSLLARIESHGLQNFKVIQHDAVEVFTHMLAPQSVTGVNIFFPDPWPKKRHHKRRLIQAPFINLLASRLVDGGILHCATDWEDYAMQMMQVLTASAQLRNCCADGKFMPRPQTRPMTKFEKRGLALGHQVWDLQFEKI